LPWPSKARGDTPRKSRNARHRDADEAVEELDDMRVPRSVTLAPIGSPARSLKDAFALARLGDQRLLPGILVRSASAACHHLLVGDRLAHAMLTVILLMRGTCITLSIFRIARRRGTTCSR